MTKSTESISDALGLETKGSTVTVPVERRRETRRPVELSSVCEFDHGQQKMECKVIDLSNSGAQLSVEQAAKLPEYFTLYILPLNMVLDCRVMWRKENKMGVYFLSLAENVN